MKRGNIEENNVNRKRKRKKTCFAAHSFPERILKPFEESEKHKVEYEVHRLVVNRVTKAHFSPALGELKDQITNSDFITVSSNKMGVSSALWTHILPIDTSKTAYLKAKAAAKRVGNASLIQTTM
ncbi:hypothetical protein MRB53_028509 [Persea americana]|uniref:Uncharacterized protein n=1 Tax=Persea americana TaxID=3435 RepID=A0ACC2KFP4_PERAE|nr:hypothetical protein MRB53_028509 [Persea americana]